MKLNYFLVTEFNGYKIKIRSQLIAKILLNIKLKCASALFYVTRRPCLLTGKKENIAVSGIPGSHPETIAASGILRS